MRALVLVPRLPGTGYTGDRVRAEFHLAALARLGAEVTLVGGAPEGASPVEVPGAATVVAVPLSPLARLAAGVHAGLRGSPLQSALLAGPWAATLARLGSGFDLTVVLLVRLWPLVASALPRGPVVLDYIDALAAAASQASRMDPSPLRRTYWRLERPRLARAERVSAERAALTLATTPFDAGALPRGTVPLAHGAVVRPLLAGPRPPRVAFTGRLGYRPNAVAAERLATEIWPLVRAKAPFAELVLAGADPPRSLLAKARREGIGVESPVASMPELLRTALVVAAPVEIGTGTPNKLFEAFEAGAAVVSSRAVAERAVLGGARPPVRTAESSEAFAEALAAYLLDPASASRDGAEGRAFVEAHASREALVARLAGLLASVVGAR